MLKRSISQLLLWSSLLQGGPAGATGPPPSPPVVSSALVTAVVGTVRPEHASGFDGVVEAVRRTVLAAQVAGAVVVLDVKVGDTVKVGQVLARIDARAANQNTAASDAQVMAARASLDLATANLERQRQLFQKSYISQGALERAESQFKSTRAQVAAQLAQASATRAQSGFFVVQAPYGGIVSEVPVALGDMAMPGRPLVTLYDPASLRVTVSVPQSVAVGLQKDSVVRIQLPGLSVAREWVTSSRTDVLPTVDPGTHSVQLRMALPPPAPGAAGASSTALAPGMFARVFLPGAAGDPARLSVPSRAVVRHAEMTGLYVVGEDGRPVLRQVRLGLVQGDSVEVLSGVSVGERVALDPQAAARAH